MKTVWIVFRNRDFYKVCSDEETARYYCDMLNAKDAPNYYKYHEEMVRKFSEEAIARGRDSFNNGAN